MSPGPAENGWEKIKEKKEKDKRKKKTKRRKENTKPAFPKGFVPQFPRPALARDLLWSDSHTLPPHEQFYRTGGSFILKKNNKMSARN
jgi:hypothetical protein